MIGPLNLKELREETYGREEIFFRSLDVKRRWTEKSLK